MTYETKGVLPVSNPSKRGINSDPDVQTPDQEAGESLKPLKTGHQFGQIEEVAGCSIDRVSNPSKRGINSDIGKAREFNSRAGLKPLKTGHQFGQGGNIINYTQD